MKFRIGVIGLWHLGCVISVSWSKLGHNVVGFDYDGERVNKLLFPLKTDQYSGQN
ncbi:MAG: hypothetical protein WC879_06240 [Melioribacteraceae bacterium]